MVKGLVKDVSSSNLMRQILVALSCSLFCLGSGCTLGFTSVLLPQINKDVNFPYDGSYYDSWVASTACLAMGFGCIPAGILSDKFGRRKTVIIGSVPFIIGWIVLAFANNITVMLLARVLTGFCHGVFRSLGPVYLGEISNPTNRPLLIFSLTVSTTGGVLLSHILGGYLNWRLACFIICLPVTLAVGLLLTLKESPLWQISKGYTVKGTDTFTWYRGNDEFSQKELAGILEKHNHRAPKLSFGVAFKSIFSKAFMKSFAISILLFTTVQFSGVNTMSFYAQDLLKSTFSDAFDPFVLMLLTDSTRVFGVTLLFTFSKYVPRRKSYLIVCSTLLSLLMVLIAYLLLKPSGLDWLAVIIMLIYISLGSILVGLSWSFVGEIFPSNLRGLGSGMGSSFSFFLLFLTVNITPGITLNYGIIATYSTFLLVSLLALIFLYFLLPRTDGKTLQEIEKSIAKE